MHSSVILVTCPKGCAAYLRQELAELGYESTSEVATGVFIRGTMEDCLRLNLLVRTGLRVLFEIAVFQARDADELYDQALMLPWERWIPENGYVSIVSSVHNDTITHTHYPALRLKDALVDRMRDQTGQRPDTGNDQTKAVLFLYWRDEEVCLYLDTSGVPLSNRDYRLNPWKAPLRENLAASIIAATRWDRRSPFVNPMCGSGTLAIEAALWALDRPAGILRENFAFMHLQGYDPARFEALRAELARRAKPELAAPIIASDLNPKAIEAARENARQAGVEDLIEFQVCDYQETSMPDEPGVVVFNPEYGERMGDEKDLLPVYQGIGDFFKQKAPGYWGYVFTGNIPLGKRVGLRPKRRIEFYNGPIECRLFEFELYAGTRDPRKQADSAE